jgi:hypothetical protein
MFIAMNRFRGLREGVAQPRYAADQGARLRRIPPAQGTRARGLQALFLAHRLAEQGGVRSLDKVGGIPRPPTRMRARTSRSTSTIRNSRASRCARLCVGARVAVA